MTVTCAAHLLGGFIEPLPRLEELVVGVGVDGDAKLRTGLVVDGRLCTGDDGCEG